MPRMGARRPPRLRSHQLPPPAAAPAGALPQDRGKGASSEGARNAGLTATKAPPSAAQAPTGAPGWRRRGPAAAQESSNPRTRVALRNSFGPRIPHDTNPRAGRLRARGHKIDVQPPPDP